MQRDKTQTTQTKTMQIYDTQAGSWDEKQIRIDPNAWNDPQMPVDGSPLVQALKQDDPQLVVHDVFGSDFRGAVCTTGERTLVIVAPQHGDYEGEKLNEIKGLIETKTDKTVDARLLGQQLRNLFPIEPGQPYVGGQAGNRV